MWRDIGDVRQLWDRNWFNIVAQSLRNDASEEDKVREHDNALRLVDDTLQQFRLEAKSYMRSYKKGVPTATATESFANECKGIQEEKKYDAAVEKKQLFDEMPDLNKEQQTIFDDVVKSVESRSPSFKNVFYADGPAGSGKTFLYRKLIHYFRSKGHIVLIVAVSGIAALLLPGGRAAHSRFRIQVSSPLAGAAANVAANSATAELFRQTTLIMGMFRIEVLLRRKNPS